MINKNKLAIFFLGPPGAGKGTQADLLAKKLGIVHLDTGALCRKKIKTDPKEKTIHESGGLNTPPTVMKWLKQEIKKINQNLILSGSPRTVYEAKKLIAFLQKNNYKIKIFNIQISPAETLKRNLLRARDIADTEDRIKERLKVYEKQTKPVLDFLGEQVIQINGQQSIENVHKNIINAGGWENFSPNNGATCASCQARCVFAGIK